MCIQIMLLMLQLHVCTYIHTMLSLVHLQVCTCYADLHGRIHLHGVYLQFSYGVSLSGCITDTVLMAHGFVTCFYAELR